MVLATITRLSVKIQPGLLKSKIVVMNVNENLAGSRRSPTWHSPFRGQIRE